MTTNYEFRRAFTDRLWTMLLKATDRHISAADRAFARRFLTFGEGFDDACIRAGMDPATVRQHVQNLLKPSRTPTRVSASGHALQPILNRRFRNPMGRPAQKITFNGQTMTRRQWADHTGLSTATISMRIFKGWSIEHVLTRPNLGRGGHQSRGVGRTSEQHVGTGAHPAAQISTELGFFGS